MIRSAIIFAVVFFILLLVGVPASIAAGVGSAVFVLSIPFSLLFGWAERRTRQADERNEALEDIAQRIVPPTGGSGTQRKTFIKDDRAVFIDNRQVNIYNGAKPKEN